jgi:Delta3-Delta2-enoyl-CoA isomerase
MVNLSKLDSAYVLRMDRGENRLSDDFLEAFGRALDEVEASPDRPLVTVGEGKFYSNGIDLEWLLGVGSEGAQTFIGRLEGLFARVIALEVPTIAALNGHAFAGGALLALCHDQRVMRTDRGYFCLPEVDISIPFTEGLAAIIRARLTPVTAHEAMITGRRYTAAEALERAIVDEIAVEAEVLDRALARAQRLAGKDPLTLKAIKQNAYREVLDKLTRAA